MLKRQPVVAGRFYAGDRERLREQLSLLLTNSVQPKNATAIIAPHAGYMYSGRIAGQAFYSVRLPAAILIIGPNHHGVGAQTALYPDGVWITPLGELPINSRLNSLLTTHIPDIMVDETAHRHEHSLEVMVPFIQYQRPDASVAALCLGRCSYDRIVAIGKGIASSIRDYGEDVLIVVSSDMTHYESSESASIKDTLALERVLAFDPEGLLQVCASHQITMCGAIPAAAMLVAAGELGATSAEVISYGTSGDVTGDNRQVVGYASVMIR